MLFLECRFRRINSSYSLTMFILTILYANIKIASFFKQLINTLPCSCSGKQFEKTKGNEFLKLPSFHLKQNYQLQIYVSNDTVVRNLRRRLLKICIPVINTPRDKQPLSLWMNLKNLSYVRNLSDAFLAINKTLDGILVIAKLQGDKDVIIIEMSVVFPTHL